MNNNIDVAADAVMKLMAGVEKVDMLDQAITVIIAEHCELGGSWGVYENPFGSDIHSGFVSSDNVKTPPTQIIRSVFDKVFNPDPKKKSNEIGIEMISGKVGERPAYKLRVVVEPARFPKFHYVKVFVHDNCPQGNFFSIQELTRPMIGTVLNNILNGKADTGQLKAPILAALNKSTGAQWATADVEPTFISEYKNVTYFDSLQSELWEDLRKSLPDSTLEEFVFTIMPANLGLRNLCIVTLFQKKEGGVRYREFFTSDNLKTSFSLLDSLRQTIPDSGDRSRNEPVYLMSAKATRSLLSGHTLDRSLDDVRRVAKQQGWNDVQAFGQQLLFIS